LEVGKEVFEDMMKKYFKKFIIFVLIVAMLVPCFTRPSSVRAASNANTLAELRKELADYKAKMNSAINNKNMTQSQINSNKNSIASAQQEIENNKQKIEEAKKRIEELDVEIADTKEKIKNLLRTHQITSGDNNYLEYIFGATSISDFIIRYNISERLASYNDNLVEQFEAKIKENEQLQVDLANREIELNKNIEKLEASIVSLGNKVASFDDEALKFEEEVKSTQDLINFYVKQGCKENEALTTCVSVKSDTGFVRPLNKGVRTSNYGYRKHPVSGVYKLHSGIDIGGNKEGTPVYSIANGMVGKIIRRSSCGGNMVYIYHTVKGVQYTSTYMHLLTINNLKVGDMVTNQTQIGTVGGGSGTKSYDSCSTGAHLHLSLAKGWYGKTYQSYSKWVSNLLDPGRSDLVNIPAMGKYFYSRSF